MSTSSRASRRVLATLAGLAVAVTGLALVPSAPANAATGVFISELHYDNVSTDSGEFVEVTAPAGTDLTGYQVVLYNGSTGATYDTDALTGVVADQQDGWGTAVVDYPANGIQNGAPDGLALVDDGTVVEFLSYEGALTATNGPASGQTATDIGVLEPDTTPVGQSLQRQADDTWAAAAPSTKGVPNGYTDGGEPAELAADDPGDKTGLVGEQITGFTLAATGGESPYTWSATGVPPGIEVSEAGVVSGTPTAAGDYTVTATVTDGAGDTAQAEFAFVVTALETVPIAEIQGTGETAALTGTQRTSGVVTAAYPTGGLNGFYLQTPGTGGAIDLATHTASDGIFVYQGTVPVTVTRGDHVQVTGAVSEFAGATQITIPNAGSVVELSEAAAAPSPAVTAWPDTDAEKESLEGMLFAPQGTFTVSNNFATNQYGELGLAVGDEPLIQPTQVGAPGSAEAAAQAADNAARAITLDDGSSTNFIASSSSAATCSPRPAPCLFNGHLTPPYISNEDPVRVGASGSFQDPVILTEGGSPSAPTYRFQPVEQVVGPDNAAAPATFENTRTATPDEDLISAEGDPVVRIASFNVLNYFTSLGDPDDDNVPNAGCLAFYDRNDDGNTVRDGCDFRGAWDPQDFQRQQTKIVDAINALGADVVGLMEIENSRQLGETPDEAVNALVAALNAEAGAGTWAANPSSSELPADGMDVITNAIIYKPAAVERVGEARALGTLSGDDQAFGNAREPIAQAFSPRAGGDPFLVVVNHFKSKGSVGPWPGDADAGDGQGTSNESRTRQAQALADWVPTIQGDVDDVFLMGDFNSYAQEDPMRLLYGEGYTNLEVASGNDEYSYSFSGLSGSLDHVLANASALERFTGADVWNINAPESVAMEYSRYNYHATDFYQEGPFRSSDHDPVIVGVDAGTPAKAASSVTAYAVPPVTIAKLLPVLLVVQVESEGDVTPTGSVTVTWNGRSRVVELRQGYAAVNLGTFRDAGTHQVEVAYAGDQTTEPSSTSVAVRVIKLF